ELVSAKKSVKDAPAIGDRNSGPRVHDGEHCTMIRVCYGDIDPSARRRIADRVVDQVTQHHPQGFRIALDDTLDRIADADVDLPGHRQGRLLRDHKASDLAQIDGLQGTLTYFGLLASQSQELADQVNGTRDSALQVVESGLA